MRLDTAIAGGHSARLTYAAVLVVVSPESSKIHEDKGAAYRYVGFVVVSTVPSLKEKTIVMKQGGRSNASWLSLVHGAPFASTVYGFSTKTAKSLVLGQLQDINRGSLLIEDADGSKDVLGSNAAPQVELHIHNPSAWLRIFFFSDNAFAEAFMLRELSCSDLTAFFRLLIASQSSGSSTIANLLSLATAPLHRLVNTSTQSLINAQDHYSLSNEMFAAFLDPTMTYSAPIWLPKTRPEAAVDTLEAAQIRKLRYTISAARIKSTDHVLEIGTGWGSFAIEAVRQAGCRVTTITASSEQALLTKQRVSEAGFSNRIEVLVCDYRNLQLPDGQRFDKIVSIEMIEHVGRQYLETYFSCIDRYLALENGIAVFQCITIPEARYARYCKRQDFIQRYIFPGGHLPTVSGLLASIDAGSRGKLVVEEVKSVSGHYVRALREWRKKFLRNWEGKVRPALQASHPNMSFEEMEIFKRKWEYYFCYCEAGFAEKVLGDVSITVGREGATQLIEDIPF